MQALWTDGQASVVTGSKGELSFSLKSMLKGTSASGVTRGM